MKKQIEEIIDRLADKRFLEIVRLADETKKKFYYTSGPCDCGGSCKQKAGDVLMYRWDIAGRNKSLQKIFSECKWKSVGNLGVTEPRDPNIKALAELLIDLFD